MPKLNTITIHPADLQNILDSLETQKHTQQEIKIIDDSKNFIIRDLNDMHIATLQKENQL